MACRFLGRTSFAVLVVCSMAIRAEAADGILIVRQVTGATATTSQSQITKTKMRTELSGANGQHQVMLFDGDKQVLDIVNMDQKTYMELTKADVDRMQTQMQGAMAQMQAQMAALPPAQRAQMEAIMSGRGMAALAAPAPKPEYRRNGADKVGRWTCDKYDVYTDGEKSGEICTVSPSALGVGATDFDVTRQMATFFSGMMPQIANQIATIGRPEEQGFAGFPVKSVTTTMGQSVTTELTDVKHQSFDDAIFAVPSGFQKQEMMGGMGTGRGR